MTVTMTKSLKPRGHSSYMQDPQTLQDMTERNIDMLVPLQVLDASLEAHVFRSDNSAIARDCRNDMKKINASIMKLGRKDYSERR